MKVKFQYWTSGALNTKGELTKRPMIKVAIKFLSGKKVEPLALIDSGADQTMMNIFYAKELGIDLTNAPVRNMNGIVGGQASYVADVQLDLPELNEKVTVPACFIDSPNVNILIGQEGFFDRFRIKFEKDHNAFEIDK